MVIYRMSLRYYPTATASELRRMVMAENVVKAYESRAQSINWAEWATENPDEAKLLARAMRLADGE